MSKVVGKLSKNWSFDIVADGKNKPVYMVVHNEQEKKLLPEQISSKVLEALK